MSDSTFTYGLEYTRNLGNFENAKPKVELTRTQRAGESEDELVERVIAKVERIMIRKIQEIDAKALERLNAS